MIAEVRSAMQLERCLEDRDKATGGSFSATRQQRHLNGSLPPRSSQIQPTHSTLQVQGKLPVSPSQCTVPDTGGTTASLQQKVRERQTFDLNSSSLPNAGWKASYISSLASTFMSSLQPPVPYISTTFPSPIITSSLSSLTVLPKFITSFLYKRDTRLFVNITDDVLPLSNQGVPCSNIT